MGDVIQFKKPEKESGQEHIFELHVYEDDQGFQGYIQSDLIDYSSEEGKLKAADALERIAWLIRKECHEAHETEDILAVSYVWDSCRVRVCWDDEKIVDKAQVDWMVNRCDDMKSAFLGDCDSTYTEYM